MRSVITTAVLATALFGQSILARGSPFRHGHQHLHAKKHEDAAKRGLISAEIDGVWQTWENNYNPGATTEAAAATTAVAATTAAAKTTTVAAASPSTTSATNIIGSAVNSAVAAVSSVTAETSEDISDLSTVMRSLMSTAQVFTANASDLVTTGESGSFVFEVQNNSGENVVLIVWTGTDAVQDYSSMCVGKTPPSLAIPIGKGDCEYISFPASTSTSGGLAVLTSSTKPVSESNSWIADTWIEYTVWNADPWKTSTVDVTNIMGSTTQMSVQAYDASSGGSATCLSSMSPARCLYTAPNSIANCPFGQNTTVDEAKTAGGCGFASNSGRAVVTIG